MLFVLVFAGIFPVAEERNNRDAQEKFEAAMDQSIISIKNRPAEYEGKMSCQLLLYLSKSAAVITAQAFSGTIKRNNFFLCSTKSIAE